MTTFNGKINIDIVFNELVSQGNLKRGVNPSRFRFLQDLPNGTSDGQINVGYAETQSGIGAGVTTAYDLVGTLTDIEGTVINFDEVILIAVRNRSSTPANYLQVGPGAANGFGILTANSGFWAAAADKNVVQADNGSWMVLHSPAGVPATAGTADLLNVITAAGSAANTWDILILGRDNV